MYKIKLCNIKEVDEIFEIYDQCRKAMQRENIFQWKDEYPSIDTVKEDIKEKTLYCYYEDENVKETENRKCLGAVCISTHQDEEYKEVSWEGENGNVIVIHRLAVNPDFQKHGIARKLMDFAEDYAKKKKYTSVRLDSFSQNKRALKFYENRGYKKRGKVFFEGRDLPFYCYELIF